VVGSGAPVLGVRCSVRAGFFSACGNISVCLSNLKNFVCFFLNINLFSMPHYMVILHALRLHFHYMVT